MSSIIIKYLKYNLKLLVLCGLVLTQSIIGQISSINKIESQDILNKLKSISSNEINNFWEKKSVIINLDFDEHSERSFSIIETFILPDGLRGKFPSIKTYSGNSISNPSEKIGITCVDEKMLISIHLEDERFRIEQDSQGIYRKIIDEKNELNHDTFEAVDLSLHKLDFFSNACIGGDEPCYPIGDSLYVYRIGMILSKEANRAVSNGTVEGGLAWVANMVNRCNLVWTRDLAMKFVLADSSHLLICTDDNKGYIPSPPHPKPTHFLLDYIKPMLNDLLGEGGYEYGHLVSTGVGGGWAMLNSQKGVSDPNYEVIIHEIGHQLGSAHNLTSEESYNAWSIGGTIMGSRDNTVFNSNGIKHGDQYSSHTVDVAIDLQRRQKTRFSNGWYHESSGNSIPVITEFPEGGFTIPIGTPFVLEGKAEDDDEDKLTYCWEQNDRANVSFEVPKFPDYSGPLFVSVFPCVDGNKRYIPNLKDLLENNYTFKEQLPFSSREINMRMIVRDNNPNCGSYTYKNLTFNSDINSGPFKILSLNKYDILNAHSSFNLQWDIANTDNFPVNCKKVKILLSTNGGESFDYTLVEDTPNDGEEIITFPNTPGDNNRIMIMANDNIFFDINDFPFKLHDPNTAGLFVAFNIDEIKILDEDSTEIEILTRGLGSTADSLTLTVISKPGEVETLFLNNDSTLTDTITAQHTLRIKNLRSLTKGSYKIIINFNSNGINEDREIKLIKTGELFTTAGFCAELKGNNIVIPKFNINTNTFSFMTWLKPNGIQDPYTAIYCLDDDKTAALNFRENNEIGYHWEGGSWSWSSGLYVNEDEWNHLAMVVKPNSVTVYLNGEMAVHSVNPEKINFLKSIRLGSYKNWSNRKFNGLIDETSFWNKALEKEDVINHMHSYLKGNEFGLMAYYQFNRQSAADAVGNYSGYYNDGNSNYIISEAPIGLAKTSLRKEIFGLVDFEEAGVKVNYSTQNGSEVVVVRIEDKPNSFEGIEDSVSVLEDQYWIYHRYSKGGIYLGDLTFEVNDFYSNSEYDLPEHFHLYNRKAGSSTEWKYVKSASLIDKSSISITFEKVYATGQFIIVNKSNITDNTNEDIVPEKFSLGQNYPNPFNPSTNINFSIPFKSKISIRIYDVLGNLIKVLADEEFLSGNYTIRWNGLNQKEIPVSSGLYFLNFSSESFNKSIKMLLIR